MHLTFSTFKKGGKSYMQANDSYRSYLIQTYIKDGTIQLCDDFSTNNLHFFYKDIEVTSPLNVPHPYYNIDNPNGLIDQILGEYEGPHELCEEDYFRKMIVHINIREIVLDGEEEDDDDDDSFFDDPTDSFDDDDDEDGESYTDRLKKHYPGLYLTPEQEKGYDHADAKRDLLDAITRDDNDDMPSHDTLFGFCYIRGLVLYDDRAEFMAPSLSMDKYEWMFWAVNVIDKILAYQSSISEDDEEGEEDE